MSTENDSWENFTLEEDDNLFQELATQEDGGEVTEKNDKKDPVDKVEKPKEDSPKEEEEEEEDLFKEIDSDPEDIEEKGDDSKVKDKIEKEDNKSKKKSTASTLDTVSFLKEKGFISYDLEGGEELTEELAEEILEDSYDAAIEERVGDLLKDLPQEVKDFNKFVINGGDPAQYLSSLSLGNKGISYALDITKPENQELVIKQVLLEEGYDEEDVEIQLDLLKDTGKLETFATKRFDKWKTEDSKKRDALVKNQELQKRQKVENMRKHKKDIQDLISTNDTVSNLKLSRKEKRELPDYITNLVESGDNKKMTQFQVDIYKVLQDKEKTVALAKILKSDFDFTDLANAIKTEVTNDTRKNLRRTEVPNKSASVNGKKGNLLEYF